MRSWFNEDRHGLRVYRAWNLHSGGLVRHGFSTRIGGHSAPPYDTLNLGLHVGDDLQNVICNRGEFGQALGLDAGRIVVPNQVHSNAVRLVTDSDAGAGALDLDSAVPDTDALITNTPGLTLALHFADCVSVFLLDPEHRAIGLAHAGRKGTAAKIVAKTLDAMRDQFGTDPTHVLAAIGPAIGRCCYEVGRDAAEEIFRAFPHDERVLRQGSVGKWRADLKTANRITLTECGVAEHNIAISDRCTSCHPEDFFSYRRDGETGRMSAWLSLV